MSHAKGFACVVCCLGAGFLVALALWCDEDTAKVSVFLRDCVKVFLQGCGLWFREAWAFHRLHGVRWVGLWFDVFFMKGAAFTDYGSGFVLGDSVMIGKSLE